MSGANRIPPRVYALYGLRVRSELPLPAPVSDSALPPYDIELRWGESRVIAGRPAAGGVLAQFAFGDGRGYTLTDTGAGYSFRFHQMCDFWIAPDLRSVRLHLPAGVAPGMAALLFTGSVLGCLLTLAGECVLHASAVEIEGSALAFVGGSGMGKSTLAALLCAEGARLVTDDLLRLEHDGAGFCCFPGIGEIRLRPGAAALAEAFPAGAHETAPDGRLALKLEMDRSMPPLSAIVIPRPSRHCPVLRVERLPRAGALLALMAYSRVQGLQQREHLQCRLDFCAGIASGIPLLEAKIPWGPPFPQEVAASLVRQGGLRELQEV